MRAGPLSDDEVIQLLNQYFIPVYSSEQESGPRGVGPSEEKAENIRIYKEAVRQPCGAGTVHVYILNPQGQVIGGLHVAEATHGNALAELLKKTVQDLQTAPGPPVVTPTPQSRPPQFQSDSLVLHLTARSSREGSAWGKFPGENWIVLSRADWMGIFPTGETKVGSSWSLNQPITRKLLANFYPQMEDHDSNVDRNRFDKASLQATVVSVSDGKIQARLDGTLLMKRTFYPDRPDDNFVNATLIGWAVFDTATNRIENLQLVTKTATYGSRIQEEFSAAVYSLSPSELKTYQTLPH
jgi:hypothetical protein